MQFWKSLLLKKERKTEEQIETIEKAKDSRNFGRIFSGGRPKIQNKKIHLDMYLTVQDAKRKRNLSLYSTESPQQEESNSGLKITQKSRMFSLPLELPENQKVQLSKKEEALLIQNQLERYERQKKLRSLTKKQLTIDHIKKSPLLKNSRLRVETVI
jgi:hypothetical protein